MEYNLQTDKELYDVSISIPIPGQSPPQMGQMDTGTYELDPRQKRLNWMIPHLDSANGAGMLEFSVQSEDVNGFYPIQVQFSSKSLFCDISIRQVSGANGEPLEFASDQLLETDKYTVE